MPYLSGLLISFNQPNKGTAQYHTNAKKLAHCEKMPYRTQPGIWFSYEFNTKSHYSIADNIQAKMNTTEQPLPPYTPKNYEQKYPFEKGLVEL